MENASKALIMAGGILIALIIIGALLLMFNQIGVYQKSNTSIEKQSQLAAFNQDFARYADTDIKGVDIISLANKIVDFNNKEGITNSVDYDKKITLKINIAGFASKYGVNGISEIFGKNTSYVVKSSSDSFMQTIKKYSNFENAEYSEFKTSTFRSDGKVIYDNGQIVELSFYFVE